MGQEQKILPFTRSNLGIARRMALETRAQASHHADQPAAKAVGAS